MVVNSATYGGVDCTAQVQAKVKGNTLIIRADNDIIGDPSVGVPKDLVMDIDGQIHTAKEGTMFRFPLSSVKRLGIFYSNNTRPETFPALRASLKSIEKAALGKADIVTCMWNHEPENPFSEFIAWTKTSSHLNQLLQILQCLYNARGLGNYETVSFLEHDVLYPEGYFDYPDVEPGTILTNMNYIGLSKEGWQENFSGHEPFHQMTMRFDEAIAHCEAILANALITNSGMIEPQTMPRRQWVSVNSAVHINYGGHFTSHCDTYSKTEIRGDDPYWGMYEGYLNLFF